MRDTGTKEAILDAAEKLFAEKGVAATSLRSIIKEAGVNTAAIHYHFGSREDLLEAVLARLADPVNRRRLETLDRIEAAHTRGPLPVEDVARAFMEPVRSLPREGSSRGLIPRLMGRALMESQETRPIMGRIMKEVVTRFAAAFCRAVPDIPQEVVMWRVHFMVGAMVFTLNVPRATPAGGRVVFETAADEDAFERLVEFVAAGMRAPVTPSSGGQR
jgi:AcrR family transcriptional regulator